MKNLVFKLHNSDITLSSRFLLLKELVSSSPPIILSFPFQFCQFLSNFLKYSSSNFLLSHSYNIFTIYFSSNSLLLKSFSSTKSNLSCFLTFAFIFLLNSATNSFVFSKFSFFFQLLCFTVNLFYCTKYFITPLTFLLFNIFSTSHSLTPSTVISLTSSFFLSFYLISALYYSTNVYYWVYPY